MKPDCAVLFDFDQTLFLGTADLNTWCFSRALEALGLAPVTKEDIEQTVGLNFEQITRLITRTDDPKVHQAFTKNVFDLVPVYIRECIQPNADVCAMLEDLKPSARLAICSNAAKSYLDPMLDALSLRGFFDMIWVYHDGVTKQAAIPRIVSALHVRRAVFVGDRLEDVAAAHANGLPVVGMRNPSFPAETENADIIVSTHTQMRSAIHKLLQSGGII